MYVEPESVHSHHAHTENCLRRPLTNPANQLSQDRQVSRSRAFPEQRDLQMDIDGDWSKILTPANAIQDAVKEREVLDVGVEGSVRPVRHVHVECGMG